jgi:SAM-dependent methyltransferase
LIGGQGPAPLGDRGRECRGDADITALREVIEVIRAEHSPILLSHSAKSPVDCTPVRLAGRTVRPGVAAALTNGYSEKRWMVRPSMGREHFSKTPGGCACNTASMFKYRNGSPLPHPQSPRYGVDAPPIPAVLGSMGVVCFLAAARWRRGRTVTAAAGTLLLAQAGVFLHTTLRGKLRIWGRELDRAGLAGNERLLDLGCGRGAVLIQAAKRLPAGRAVGVDLWSRDQSGNSPKATLANAAAAGVADRVEVHTADMTALPFADGSFEIVTSALAIHNIRSPQDRYQAVDEAMRVLRPGGQLLVADPSPMARKYAAYIGQGTLRGLGLGYWYGGPWFGVTLLHAVKGR